MSLFNSSDNGKQPAQQQMTPRQAWQQFQQNPIGSLKQAGLNIPDGMNNPQQIVQHLMQTGQVPQGRLQQAMQMAGQMMGRR